MRACLFFVGVPFFSLAENDPTPISQFSSLFSNAHFPTPQVHFDDDYDLGYFNEPRHGYQEAELGTSDRRGALVFVVFGGLLLDRRSRQPPSPSPCAVCGDGDV